MNKQQSLSLMKSPSDRRPGKWREGVMQIHLTRACDRSCYSCTQGSNLGGKTWFMSLDNFEKACKSLDGYFGVIGVFGGNPGLAPNFGEICEILRRYFPKEQCGIWCNHPKGNGHHMAKTFNPRYSNLNVHRNKEAYVEFKRTWPESMPFGLNQDSRHSPVHLAMMDLDLLPNPNGRGKVVNTEENRWSLISNCDINQHWSATICEINGQAYGYFCEVAAAQAILHHDDPDWPILGLDIEQDYHLNPPNPIKGKWWQLSMESYSDQVEFHCHRCGFPLRGHGQLDNASEDEVEQTSATHVNIFKPKRKGRKVEIVDQLVQLEVGRIRKGTDYLGNANR